MSTQVLNVSNKRSYNIDSLIMGPLIMLTVLQEVTNKSEAILIQKIQLYPIPLPYTNATPSLSLMPSPLLSISELHAKSCDVCAS